MSKLSFYLAASTLLATLLVSPVHAQGKQDFTKPIHVSANQEELDIKSNTLVLTDNVVVTQGSLLIKADKLEASGSDDAEHADTFIARGTPALYEQTLEDNSRIRAQAETIIYYQSKQLVIMEGDAVVEQGSSILRGERITHDLAAQKVLVEKGDSQQERVTTIFTPKKPSSEHNDDKQSEQ
ncbi:lipopolysaccharide transport periplasmic protein LptA [Idiomarina tyrosinivorans]|uniref:Lipopolysaccharide export system protein LptA n=1 Tax=Idiomarina tyrosinivorans TaxID=1445662 RepID=A0A432ZQL0_9GAMM|nr:lipopolysaccharide transport periplasmic protein LptA [Idiomarina tyrosinivorans]RUO80116.1 lipopolysaccharide transport periplasmic protein LptA [Idiomarina tyrosinivorans]